MISNLNILNKYLAKYSIVNIRISTKHKTFLYKYIKVSLKTAFYTRAYCTMLQIDLP